MTLPALLPIPDIQARLQLIFPAGLTTRLQLVREMTAKTVFVFLYGGMVEGGKALRPSHVYLFTDEQAALQDDADRLHWVQHSLKPGFRPAGKRWYADTTREPIRDETLRFGLADIGAVGRLPGIPTTSSLPIYFLTAEFAALFDPALTGTAFETAALAWQTKHLTPAARARMALLASGKVKKSDEVTVTCPDGTIAKLAAGPSSEISKAVVEEFASLFMPTPALLWMSESGNKVRYEDAVTSKALGLKFDASKHLPDIIFFNVGTSGTDSAIVFIEVVHSDGEMNQERKEALLKYVAASGFPADQCLFGTAFADRADPAFRKALPKLAWGSFAWFATEPEKLMLLADEPYDITA